MPLSPRPPVLTPAPATPATARPRSLSTSCAGVSVVALRSLSHGFSRILFPSMAAGTRGWPEAGPAKELRQSSCHWPYRVLRLFFAYFSPPPSRPRQGPSRKPQVVQTGRNSGVRYAPPQTGHAHGTGGPPQGSGFRRCPGEASGRPGAIESPSGRRSPKVSLTISSRPSQALPRNQVAPPGLA